LGDAVRRLATIIIGLALLAIGGADGQAVNDPATLGLLKKLFPNAAAFAPKAGSPPAFKALASDAKDAQVLGYAYWTTEIEPLERGYDGPIKMLVGMDTMGTLTGVIVTDDREPYGYFSVETPEFAAQFKNKSVRDPFKVGQDIDAISRATISVTSASRAVRNSSRKVARAYLAPASPAPNAPSQ
jgi:transcriptional regulator of nitric oxide reductase